MESLFVEIKPFFYGPVIIKGAVNRDIITVSGPSAFISDNNGNRLVSAKHFQKVSDGAGPARIPKKAELDKFGGCRETWTDRIIGEFGISDR